MAKSDVSLSHVPPTKHGEHSRVQVQRASSHPQAFFKMSKANVISVRYRFCQGLSVHQWLGQRRSLHTQCGTGGRYDDRHDS
jgi:hypothetical protein